MGIYNVDTIGQQFECKLWVQLKWAVTSQVTEPHNMWYPRWDIINNKEEPKILETKWKTKPHGDYTHVYYSQVIQGKFAERFELQKFPFDFQLLQIRGILWDCPQHISKMTPHGMRTLECAKPVTFINGGSLIYKEAFIQRDAWRMVDKVFISQNKTHAERNEDGIQYATLDIKVCIWRSCNFYMYNIVAPIFLMVILSFTSFISPCSELDNKMQINLTLLLTLVAFKLAVAQYIPATSYLTYLDKYVILSFVYLSIVTGQGVLCYSLDENIQYQFNRISAFAFMVAWVLINIFWCSYIFFIRYKTLHSFRAY